MHVLIVEDYPQVAKRVARLTQEIIENKLTSIKILPNFGEAESYLERHTIDLLLLDLNLGGDDGFDLLKRAVARAFQTIVISANTDRALEAFEYGVLDFVPKPFSKERLEKAFDRLTGANQAPRQMGVLAVKDGGRLRMIDIADVAYIKGAGNYSELHLKSGGSCLHEKNLDRLGTLLNPQFERVHKSYMVAFNEIEALEVHRGGKYALLTKSGAVLPLGRTRYKALRERMGVD